MVIRKALVADAQDIYTLISWWAKRRLVLERSLNHIYENIRDYWVAEEKGEIIGVCALHVVGWQGLGEVKSLVVKKKYHGKGIGKGLVQASFDEARSLGLKKVFALTFVPAFFEKLGFVRIDRNKLPHKIWSDCINCIYFPDCKEKAVLKVLKDRKNH